MVSGERSLKGLKGGQKMSGTINGDSGNSSSSINGSSSSSSGSSSSSRMERKPAQVNDPRAVLGFPEHLTFPEDSGLWVRLLTLAYEKRGCGLLARNLEGFRAEGTRILKLPGGGLGLRPVIRPGVTLKNGDGEESAGSAESAASAARSAGAAGVGSAASAASAAADVDNVDAGWRNEAQYRYYADKYLKPWHDVLVELLRELAEKRRS